MARQRRGGGGFKTPELRGTLGTLLRTTLQQAGVVRDAARDALERGAREGRTRLDDLRANRRRHEALAELGEIVLDLIRRGEIDLAELPEARAIIDHLDELDVAAEDEGAERDATDTVPPPTRRRFDDRPRRTSNNEEDGTVSSSRWTPPSRRPGRPTKIWKPKLDDVEPEPAAAAAAAADPASATADQPPTVPGHKALPPRDPKRKGGIQFNHDDDDDDLADYMHADDVPKKPD